MKYHTIAIKGESLLRIIADETIGDVKLGDEGGIIESENNLSQDGLAWIFWYSQVTGNARVSGNAQIISDCFVFENAQVKCMDVQGYMGKKFRYMGMPESLTRLQ